MTRKEDGGSFQNPVMDIAFGSLVLLATGLAGVILLSKTYARPELMEFKGGHITTFGYAAMMVGVMLAVGIGRVLSGATRLQKRNRNK